MFSTLAKMNSEIYLHICIHHNFKSTNNFTHSFKKKEKKKGEMKNYCAMQMNRVFKYNSICNSFPIREYILEQTYSSSVNYFKVQASELTCLITNYKK